MLTDWSSATPACSNARLKQLSSQIHRFALLLSGTSFGGHPVSRHATRPGGTARHCHRHRLDRPALILLLPLAAATGFLLWRDRAIRRRVGFGAWPSDGFARHVLVDDLGHLATVTLASAPLFFLGQFTHAALPLL